MKQKTNDEALNAYIAKDCADFKVGRTPGPKWTIMVVSVLRP